MPSLTVLISAVENSWDDEKRIWKTSSHLRIPELLPPLNFVSALISPLIPGHIVLSYSNINGDRAIHNSDDVETYFEVKGGGGLSWGALGFFHSSSKRTPSPVLWGDSGFFFHPIRFRKWRFPGCSERRNPISKVRWLLLNEMSHGTRGVTINVVVCVLTPYFLIHLEEIKVQDKSLRHTQRDLDRDRRELERREKQLVC